MQPTDTKKLLELIKTEMLPTDSYFNDGWNNALLMILQRTESGDLAVTPPAPSGEGLLPCPFCGNGAEYCRSEGVTGRKWYVRCKTVRCYLFLHNKETVFERRVEAQNDWNRRI